jgi:hypothetical protein
VGLRESLYLGLEILAAATVFAALRLNRPARPAAWALIGLGMAMQVLGDASWDWLSLVQNSSPSPSVADAFYLLEYPFLLLGAVMVIRGHLDRATILDTLIVTTASAVVIWEVLVQPQLRDGTPSVLLLVDVAYPIADIALIGAVAGFLLSAVKASTAFRLLGAGLVLMLVADIAYLEFQALGLDLDPSPVDFLYPMSLCLWAAAALHPSARNVQSAAGLNWLCRRYPRLVTLGGACLLVPIAVLFDALSGYLADLPWILLAWVVLVGLVLGRMDEVLSQAQASERRFRTIFEGSPAGVGITRDDTILEANASLRSMLGLSDDVSLAATSVGEHVAPRTREDVKARRDARLAGEPEQESFETVGMRADGTEFPLEVRARDVRLADGPATIGFFRDLTEQQAAQTALRSSERMYRELFDGNPLPMWIYDLETLRFLAVNDTAVHIYGWSREEFLAMSILDIRPAEDIPAVLANIRESAASFQLSGPWRHSHRDGSTVEVEVSSHNLVWTGRSARLVLSLDVTQRIRLEEQLRQSQKMEAIGRLAGGVAHDFNNMLTAISGYTNLVKAGLEPDNELVADLDEVLQASARAASLTAQLLAFSRRQVLQPQVIDPNEAIAGMVGMLRRLIGDDVVLRTTLAEGVAPIRVDPSQLLQVVMNLAVNARDAMPDGGTLTIETADVVIGAAEAESCEDAQPGPHVVISVTDSGTGMDAATLRRAFEPFFTTKPIGTGTGLGLATVYGIVSQSGGWVSASSEVGHGTTIKTYLPIASAREPSLQAEVMREPAPFRPATVLVVEDEASVRSLVVALLGRQGYDVLEAMNSEEGEAIAAAHPGSVDLLLTDVVMPGRSGSDLAAEMLVARPDLKVLFMSGYTENAIVHERILDDGVAFLGKPFDPDALLAKIRALLDDTRVEEPGNRV